jgi:hypothetical protein
LITPPFDFSCWGLVLTNRQSAIGNSQYPGPTRYREVVLTSWVRNYRNWQVDQTASLCGVSVD